MSSIANQWNRITKQGSSENGSVLAALSSPEEWASLRKILGGAGWELRKAADFADARAALAHSSFDAVVCAAGFPDGHSWKDMLAEIQANPVPPELIVADRLADCALWAEVLNLGCYDLLATPFEAAEVLRVVLMACEFRRRKRTTPLEFRKPPKAADVSRPHVGAMAAARRVRKEEAHGEFSC